MLSCTLFMHTAQYRFIGLSHFLDKFLLEISFWTRSIYLLFSMLARGEQVSPLTGGFELDLIFYCYFMTWKELYGYSGCSLLKLLKLINMQKKIDG